MNKYALGIVISFTVFGFFSCLALWAAFPEWMTQQLHKDSPNSYYALAAVFLIAGIILNTFRKPS